MHATIGNGQRSGSQGLCMRFRQYLTLLTFALAFGPLAAGESGEELQVIREYTHLMRTHSAVPASLERQVMAIVRTIRPAIAEDAYAVADALAWLREGRTALSLLRQTGEMVPTLEMRLKAAYFVSYFRWPAGAGTADDEGHPTNRAVAAAVWAELLPSRMRMFHDESGSGDAHERVARELLWVGEYRALPREVEPVAGQAVLEWLLESAGLDAHAPAEAERFLVGSAFAMAQSLSSRGRFARQGLQKVLHEGPLWSAARRAATLSFIRPFFDRVETPSLAEEVACAYQGTEDAVLKRAYLALLIAMGGAHATKVLIASYTGANPGVGDVTAIRAALLVKLGVTELPAGTDASAWEALVNRAFKKDGE